MSPRGSEARRSATPGAASHAMAGLVLTRVACEGGATRTEIVRDLAPITSHKLSPGEWRAAVDEAVSDLVAEELACETRGRLLATERGLVEAGVFLGAAEQLPASNWSETRDVALVARALGMAGEPVRRKRALADPKRLRALVVQRAYGLKGKATVPPAKLRAQLAVVALERAFGNKIKAGIGKGERLPSKAARALAAQLSRAPRDFSSDERLIAQLAAEQVGALQPEPDAVRTAILRGFVASLLEKAGPSEGGGREASPPLPRPANDRGPSSAGKPAPRPDLRAFASAVQRAATARAQGWPARAFICHVWEVIRAEHSDWSLSEIEFKAMLAEAHRHGAIKLATADLKSKSAEFERSETPFGANTVMHYVRADA